MNANLSAERRKSVNIVVQSIPLKTSKPTPNLEQIPCTTLKYIGNLRSVPTHGHSTRTIGSTIPEYSTIRHTIHQVPDTRNHRMAIFRATKSMCAR